jgi:CRP-like cAMP-binding protein
VLQHSTPACKSVTSSRTHVAAAGGRDLFVSGLAKLHRLSALEERALAEVITPPEAVGKGTDIVSDGVLTSSVTVVLAGVACRYKVLSEGQRQILGFVLPGDLADLSGVVLGANSHGVSASTRCFISHIPRDALQRLMDAYPNFARAMWRHCLVQSSIYQSWLVNMRRRPAEERLAHLFCEQFLRLEAAGLAEPGQPVRLHIVQSDLADATGMSPVHLNRTLQYLRSRNLIGRNPAALEIIDWDGLKELAQFEASYLHLDKAGEGEPPLLARLGSREAPELSLSA